MPWLPIYADEEDFRVIHDWLNQNDEIAFIVSDGPRRWRAVQTVAHLDSARICLWHVPSGPLPLSIDPWKGWTIRGWSGDYPCFGTDNVGLIWFNRRPKSHRQPDAIGLSSFEWPGNLYATAGRPAPETTKRFWASLRIWIKKNAVRIPRSGPLDGPRPKIWAFPSALSAIKHGRDRANNSL
jgi:hypothetical protein